MGGGSSFNPKPIEDGYSFEVDATAKAWTAASRVVEEDGATGSDGRPSLKRGASSSSASKWNKAKYAVQVSSGFNAAGKDLAKRRSAASTGRNGWVARELSLGPVSHRSVDKFDQVAIIGRGVMGEVTLAKFRKDNQYVALKAVSKGYVAKHDDERHVHNERTILTKLRHPFVVSLFGTFQDAKRIYFVLEFLGGGELFSKVRGNKCLTAESAKFYLAEILCGLAYVHASGYAYRDLKPENVMLDLDGHCRLVDFGFACAPPGDADSGLMRTNCGTPAYLSPEQLSRKKTGGYTRIVDWWAFGCVTYELMTGRTPFCKDHSEDSHHAIYLRVIKGKISFPGHVAATAKQLVKLLLAADVSKRLTSAEAVKIHSFFEHVDWQAVEQKRAKPPSEPLTLGPGDTSQFDEYRPRQAPDDNYESSRCNFHGF